MHGSSGSRGLFVHLLAGAALGAVVVLMAWIFSGGRPFGEVVGTAGVSAPTTTPVERTDVERRTGAPAAGGEQLGSAPPALGGEEGGSDAIQFRKPSEAERPAKARRKAAARRGARAKARTRKRQAVRVLAPPAAEGTGGAEGPVAAVPSPVPVVTPAPAAAAPPPGETDKPVKPRRPSYVAGAGEG